MKIGIPKEVKVKENRVSCTPGGARQLVNGGHQVFVQTNAGMGAGYPDELYRLSGATIVSSAADAWACEMVIKVKEPIQCEYDFFHEGLILFTYLHLAADAALTHRLVKDKVVGIAYETIEQGKRLPLLEPMSEIAGRMSTLMGAYYLGKNNGGNGVLLGGVPGVSPGKVMVLGGGTAGVNAGRVATGLGSNVTIMEVDIERMHFLEIALDSSAHTLFSDEQNIIDGLADVDLLIGAILKPGAKADKLITHDFMKRMRPGSVFVDIAIDQGGCAETSHVTTHEDPVYVEHDVVHYCVGNMPGAYPRTATQALTNATIPYVHRIANLGYERALRESRGFALGLNTFEGGVTYDAVATAVGLPAETNPFVLAEV